MSVLRSIVTSSRALATGAKDVARFRQIAAVFITHGFGWTISQLRLRRELQVDYSGQELKRLAFASEDTGRRLVAALTELGPTWIKFGQILSTRGELLPASIITQLSTLQDAVKPVPYEEIDCQLRRSLGQDFRQSFSNLNEVPLASASIGQVHRARLIKGHDVVLKIQRPGIRGVIESDLHILLMIAGYIEEAFEEAQAMNLRGIVTDFTKSIAQELDYRSEANNLERFQRNFNNDPDIYFPRVYREYSSTEVLCMEYIEGKKFSEVLDEGGNTDALIETYFKMAYRMLFVDGFFHGDLHPGNVFILEDHRLAIIDCGMVGRLSPARKDKVIDLIYAVLYEDLEAIARIFFALAIPQGSLDYAAFEADAIAIAERYIGGVPLSQISIGELFADMVAGAAKHNTRMPTDFTMMFKAIATTEGLARSIAPNVDPVALAKPFVLEMVSERYSIDRLKQAALSDFQLFSSTLRSLPRNLPLLLDGLQKGRIAIGVADSTLRRQNIAHATQTTRIIRAAFSIATLVSGTLALGVNNLAILRWGIPYVSVILWIISLLLASSLALGSPTELKSKK